jgi:hypothetical protein
MSIKARFVRRLKSQRAKQSAGAWIAVLKLSEAVLLIIQWEARLLDATTHWLLSLFV